MELETSTNIIQLDSPTVSSSSNGGNLQSSISNGILSSQISNLEQMQTTSQTETLVPVAEHPKLFSTLQENNFNNQINQNNSNNLPESSSNGIEQMTSQTMNAADQALLLTTEIMSNVTINPVLESASIGVATNLEPMTTSQIEILTSNQTIDNVDILGQNGLFNETSQNNVTANPISESSTSSITDFAASQVSNETILSSESTPNLNNIPIPESTISESQLAPIPGLNAINDPDYVDSGISNSMPDFTSVEDSDLLPGLNHPIGQFHAWCKIRRYG